VTHEFGTVDLAHKQVTSCSFCDPQQRIEDQINTFWIPLGRHFVCSLRGSIHEKLHVALTRKYMYVEKLRDIYTSNCLKMTEHLDIYLLTFWTYMYILPFGYKYYNLDIYTLQFGHTYCNLDINMETQHIYMTFQHIDPV